MIRRKHEPPRGVLKSTPSDARPYRHARYHPASALAPYVEHYWVVEWDLTGQQPQQAAVLPHPSVQMTFEAGRGGQIAGVMTGKFVRELKRRGRVFGVKFTPGGFRPFAAGPIADFADKTLPPEQLFGDAGSELVKEVLAHDSDADRVVRAERFLIDRRPAHLDDDLRTVSAIVYQVAEDRSLVQVRDIVDRFGLPTRKLQRLFANYVGVSPKWVIQRYRLHEAAEQLGRGEPVDHAELAHRLGYSDQAHFIRDFKALVGTSPAAYAKSVASGE